MYTYTCICIELGIFKQCTNALLSYQNQFAILPRKNKKQDKWWGKRQNCAAFNNVTRDYRRRRRDNGVPEPGQRRHFTTLDDFTGLPRTFLSASTMYATINELSQECSSIRTDFMGRKRRSLSLSLSTFSLSGTKGTSFVRELLRNKAVMSVNASSVAEHEPIVLFRDP